MAGALLPREPPWGRGAWDVLQIITSSSADGITIQDANGALIYANDSAGRMAGFSSGLEMQRASPEEIVARFEMLDEDGIPFPIEQLPGRRAMAGDPQPESVIRFRRRSGGADHWALVRATPMFDDDGSVHHVVNVFVDVSADRRRRQAQLLLEDATKELAQSLDWEATLQRVAMLAVPDMADWCTVDLLQPDGSLRLIAVAHVDAQKAEWARELRRRFPPSPDDASGVAHVIKTGRSEIVPTITREMIDAANIADPDLREVIDRLRLNSIMYVPLTAGERTLGVLTMVWAESGNHYSAEDLRVAEDLAVRAAFAIDNARLYRERDEVARSLQERLLPKSLPSIPGLTAAARYIPAGELLQAGGDFYDLFEMDDGSWKAVIGDVCGKGPQAAGLMGFVRFTTRAVSRQDTKPSEALVKLNRALREELEDGAGEFCTAAVVRIRPRSSGALLTIAVAGHPLPIVLRSDGTLEEVGVAGTLLGVLPEIRVSDEIAELRPRDTLIMLTDGVLEAGREEAWQASELPALLSECLGMSAEAIADRIQGAVESLRERRTDDIAILVIQCA
jgi:PAS domain S-box-containing protein